MTASVVFIVCILVSRFGFDRVNGVDIIMSFLVAVMSIFMLPIDSLIVMGVAVSTGMCIGLFGGVFGYPLRKRFPILNINLWGKDSK